MVNRKMLGSEDEHQHRHDHYTASHTQQTGQKSGDAASRKIKQNEFPTDHQLIQFRV
jgi:hypothetical protein